MRLVSVLIILCFTAVAAIAGSECQGLFNQTDHSRLIRSLADLRLKLDLAQATNMDTITFSVLQADYLKKELEAEKSLDINREELVAEIRQQIDKLQDEKKVERNISDEQKKVVQAHYLLGEKAEFIFVKGKRRRTKNESTDDFYMMSTHVTQHIWAEVAELANRVLKQRNPITVSPSTDLNSHLNPVETVSMEDIHVWLTSLNKLSEIDHPSLKDIFPEHKTHDTYDLPYIKEWKHVFELSRENWDSKEAIKRGMPSLERLNEVAWVIGPGSVIHPVGTKPPFRIGKKKFYDISGNAWQVMRDLSTGVNVIVGGLYEGLFRQPNEGVSFRLVKRKNK